MNILLVDGNEKEASDRYTKLGMDTQFQVYEKILKKDLVLERPKFFERLT